MNNFKNTSNESNNNFSEDELDFSGFIKLILRNKKLILLTTLFSTLFTIIYSYKVSPIWKGSFNILVKDNSGINSLSNNLFSTSNFPVGSKLSLLSGNDNKTEELILKSPSVLLPVYKYVLKFNKENGVKEN